MAHYSRLHTIVIDVPGADHTAALEFWRAATGATFTQHDRHPEYHWAVMPEQQFVVLVQRLDDEGPSRVHLDIHTTDVDAEVARLERLGATRVRPANDWWIMHDPAGLPFCVIPDRSSGLDADNAKRWE